MGICILKNISHVPLPPCGVPFREDSTQSQCLFVSPPTDVPWCDPLTRQILEPFSALPEQSLLSVWTLSLLCVSVQAHINAPLNTHLLNLSSS